MSGPSSLGTLLATRLDAVLGTTLAQHPVLLEGRGHVVAQPAQTLHRQDSTLRRGTGEVRDGGAQVRSRAGATADSGQSGARPGQAGQLPASARTVLSEPARLILALLLSQAQPPRPHPAPLPLWPTTRDPGAAARFTQPGQAGPQRGTAPPSARPGLPGAEQTQSGVNTRPMLPGPGLEGVKASLPQPESGTPGSGKQAQSGAVAAGRQPATAAARTGAGERAEAQASTSATRGDAARQGDSPRLVGNEVRSDVRSGLAPSGPQATAPTASATPLSASNPMSQALAASLARVVSGSGMFYESHLAKLAFGQMRPQDLAREPQARLAQPSTLAAHETRHQAVRSSMSEWLNSPINKDSAPSPRTEQAASSQTATPTVPGVNSEAASMVRQQLETLANNQFTWQGQPWPGSEMEWDIHEERPDAADEHAPAWTSHLKLQMPTLGEVEVRLQLSGNRVQLRLASADSAEVLDAASLDLRARLHDAGLILHGLDVVALDAQATQTPQTGPQSPESTPVMGQTGQQPTGYMPHRRKNTP